MKRFLLLLCGVTMFSVSGMASVSEAAWPRATFNRGYRQGARAVNTVARRVGAPVRVAPGYYGGRYGYGNRYGYGARYGYGPYSAYNRGYYGGSGVYLRF